MHAIPLIIGLFSQPTPAGYIESRPYLAVLDSLTFNGYTRGWLELKQDGPDFGGQIVLDCQVPYDTFFFSLTEQVRISRLALWIGPENLRITAGRQRLYWGVGRVFRPFDILNPANYLEPGYERPGTDAILGHAALGPMTSIRGIVVPKTDIDRSLVGLRLGANWFSNDLGLNVFHRQSDRMTLFGGEIAGEAQIGYWGEFGYAVEDTHQYPKASAGADYTFPFSLYCMLEFLHDGSGARDPEEYDFSRITSGERSFLAQDYFYGSLELTRNPYLKPSLGAIVNINDNGFILIPQVYYSLLDNVDLTFGSNIIRGPHDSEFENIIPADLFFYAWAKIYF